MGVTTEITGAVPAGDADEPTHSRASTSLPAPAGNGAARGPLPLAGAATVASLGAAGEVDDVTYARVAAVMRVARGLDLDAFKPRWIRRRIALRVRARGCVDGAAYATTLEGDPAEVERLNRALTITVSQFFRNLATFERIAEAVLPPLFERAGSAGLRIWSVGCASGEEPYSVALLLRERFADRLARTRVSILGFDRDAEALERARAAVYERDRLAELPAEIRERHFEATGAGRFQLAREIRQMVAFRQANVFDAAALPQGPVDMVLCRNVLIYFARPEQERLLADFEQRLAPGGFLVLGKAETLVASDRRRFKTVCPWERIYRRP